MDPTQRFLTDLRSGKATRQAKMAAAQGLIPLDGQTLPRVLFFLSLDSDTEIQAAARTSFTELPESFLEGAAANEATPPEFLDFLAKARLDSEPLLLRVVGNRSSTDATIMSLAESPLHPVLERIAVNQMRMLRSPTILDVLLANSACSQTLHLSLEDFQRTFADRIKARRAAIEAEARAAAMPAAPKAAQPDQGEQQEWVEDVFSQLETRTAPSMVLGGPATDATGLEDPLEETDEEEDEDDWEDDWDKVEESPDLRQALRKLPISEKMLKAKMGTKQERALLVKDTNKKVAVAAIQSPLISEFEVAMAARDRVVSDDVLREIAMSRDWMKSYKVVLALVHNPKTPPGVSLRLLHRLHDSDLKDLSRDREVPYGVRAAGERVMEIRARRRGQ